MRKLMLKKEVVARIEHDEMIQLRGGYDPGSGDNACRSVVAWVCQPHESIDFGHSCNGTCNGTCPADYTCQGQTCNGANTCSPYQCATQGCPAKTVVYDDCPTGQSTPMKTC